MILLENIDKRYGKKEVFKSFSTKFEDDKITVLMGENGAGKSTLLNMITTVEHPDKGHILYDGKKMKRHEIRRIIGFIPQEIALFTHMSVMENIHFFKSLHKNPISDARIQSLMDQLYLTDIHQPIEKLSGGTKRKANILIGLLGDPKIIVLDEPTEGIDIKARFEIHQLLNKLKQDRLLILTTHHLDEVINLADYIKVIGQDPFYQDILTQEGLAFEVLKNKN